MIKLSRNWLLLIKTIDDLPVNCSPIELAEVIVSWLSSDSIILKESNLLGYNFDVYVGLKIGNYPVNESSLCGAEFEHFKKMLKNKLNGSLDVAFQFLCGTLEKLFYRQVDMECKNCGWWEFSVYKDKISDRLVYMCNQCGLAYLNDGSRFKAGDLGLVTNGELFFLSEIF